MKENINKLLGIDPNIEVTGPYFFGQKPEECGHYNPDVMLVEDLLNSSKLVKRTFFCFKCNKYYNREISIEELNRESLDKLYKTGRKIYGTLQELSEFRKSYLLNVFSHSDW